MTAELFKAGLEEDLFDPHRRASVIPRCRIQMASMIRGASSQRRTLIWVQAENSKIDPAGPRSSSGHVRSGPLCAPSHLLRHFAQGGPTWGLSMTGGSLFLPWQTAVEAISPSASPVFRCYLSPRPESKWRTRIHVCRALLPSDLSYPVAGLHCIRLFQCLASFPSRCRSWENAALLVQGPRRVPAKN